MNLQELIRTDFEESKKSLESFVANEENVARIARAADEMAATIKSRGKIISCGNGGSMSDAMHFAEELSGRFRDDRKALPAVAISDPGHLSCVANDYGYEQVFSRYVEALGNAGDMLLAISTSGNSANVLRAAEAARKKNMKVIALTGKDGGLLAKNCDIEIRSTNSHHADRAQEIHIVVIHTLIHAIEHKLFNK